MNAKDIIKSIKTGFWINPITEKEFEFIKKMKTPPTFKFYKEVTIRIDVGEKTRFGRPKPQRRRLDAVALCKPHYNEVNKLRKSSEKLYQKKGFLDDSRSARKGKYFD